MTVFRAVVLLAALSSPLTAQGYVLGVWYEAARTDHINAREAHGLGIRLRFRAPVELRYDYLAAGGERFDSPCGGFIPPGCGPETIHYSSRLHNLFIAARLRVVTFGAVQVFVLPEAGLLTGRVVKRGIASGIEDSGGGGGLGAGAAVELSAPRIGGSAFGGWIAARMRGFVHPGAVAADGYEPLRSLDRIGSIELGVTVAFQ